MRILGVDDNPDILKFVQITVESMGHEFDSAHGGRAGLAKIQTGRYDMVFLDLSMPDFSGLDVIAALEDGGSLEKYRIVLFTASYIALTEMEKDMTEKGVLGVLAKPADIDQIMEMVQRVDDSIR